MTTTGAASVAGRDAYELVLAPKDTASLIGQVRLAIDAKEHIPLRVDVYAKGANDPAVRVAFQQISFAVPDAEQFTLQPAAGHEGDHRVAVVDRGEAGRQGARPARPPVGKAPVGKRPAAEAEPTVVGKGWTSILVAKMPKSEGAEQSAVAGVLDSLPKVSGTWGSGKLLSGALFSALLTDDGRVLVGAVAPEKLYEAAGR